MFTLLLLIAGGGALGAAAYWLMRRGPRPTGGALRTEVDQLNLPEAEAALEAARSAYLAGMRRGGGEHAAESQLERAVFLMDRIHRLQGMTHGAGARERWKSELRQQAERARDPNWNTATESLS